MSFLRSRLPIVTVIGALLLAAAAAVAETRCKSWFLGICTEHMTPEEQARADVRQRFYDRIYARFCPKSMLDLHDCLVDITARLLESEGFALVKCSSDGHAKRSNPQWATCFTHELTINAVEFAEAACRNSGYSEHRDSTAWETCVQGETIVFPSDWYRFME